MLPMYYKDAKGAIITYDIGSRESFENLQEWIDALNDHVDRNKMVIYIVGNKKDLDPNDKKVPTADAAQFAKDNGLFHAEVSAKTGDGVQ
mmetsp:Transcript_82448/g.114493  ORF Transcript_82448/g.114493 Transcript_82448/m.114493 type:complete len:90 (-) Transcript_82448:68-337(-)